MKCDGQNVNMSCGPDPSITALVPAFGKYNALMEEKVLIILRICTLKYLR